MSTIPQAEIDHIKAQYAIRPIVSRWIELDKHGRACCPFHQEKSPSFKVSEDGYYKCFGCGAGGDVISFVQTYKAVSFKEACEIITGQVIEPERTSFKNGRIIMLSDRMAEGPDETPKSKPVKKTVNKFQALWEAKVANFTDEFAESVALNRGLDSRVFWWLRENKLIGLHDSTYVAFPVHDDAGNVVRCHVKDHDKDTWTYEPQCAEKGTQSLIIGDTKVAKTTFALESQWDAFAIMSALQHWESPNDYAYIITRGASSNTDILKHVNPDSRLILIPQNDPDDKKDSTGKTPAEKWLERCKAGIPASVKVYTATTPEGYEDPNDWIAKANPSIEDVTRQFTELIQTPENNQSKKSKRKAPVKGVNSFPTDPPPETIIIGNGAIRIGDQAFFNSGAGMGKSVAAGGCAMAWALGLPYFGIKPARPLRILHYVGEDDESTMGQIREGFLMHSLEITGVQLTAEDLEPLDEMLETQFDRSAIGNNFLVVIKEEIEAFKPDLVLINPLLSYIDGDIVKEVTTFLRGGINPLLAENKCAALIFHHTCKLNKESWNQMDPAYSGIGGGDVANIPRIVLTMMPAGEGMVRLQASKRTTVGWMDEVGNHKTYAFFRRTDDPTRPAWLPVSYEEGETKPAQAESKAKTKCSTGQVIAILQNGPRWKSAVINDLMRLPCGMSTAKAVIKHALEMEAIFQYDDKKKPTQGGSARKWLTLTPPQDDDEQGSSSLTPVFDS